SAQERLREFLRRPLISVRYTDCQSRDNIEVSFCILSKAAIEKRVVNGLAVIQRNDVKDTRGRLPRQHYTPPETYSSIRLYLAPDRKGNDIHAPLPVNIGAFS